MNTYLTIMVTILVLTQIVRIIQNTIQLRRQYKLFQAQLGQLDDITQEDLDMQRRAYAYQIYGDNNDEPIARCKSCPLCQSDKIRHKQKPAHNDPLTLDELMQMDGKPVWVICDEGFEPLAFWALVEVCEESIFLTNNLGGRTEYAADVELEDDGITVYHRKLEEGTV